MALFNSNNDKSFFSVSSALIRTHVQWINIKKKVFLDSIYQCNRYYVGRKKLGFLMTKTGKHQGAKCKLFMTLDIA